MHQLTLTGSDLDQINPLLDKVAAAHGTIEDPDLRREARIRQAPCLPHP